MGRLITGPDHRCLGRPCHPPAAATPCCRLPRGSAPEAGRSCLGQAGLATRAAAAPHVGAGGGGAGVAAAAAADADGGGGGAGCGSAAVAAARVALRRPRREAAAAAAAAKAGALAEARSCPGPGAGPPARRMADGGQCHFFVSRSPFSLFYCFFLLSLCRTA